MFEVVAGIGFRSRVIRRARPKAGARLTGFFLTVAVGARGFRCTLLGRKE